MNFDRVMQLIGRWAGTMKFFPSEPDARIGIADEIAAMATDEEQVRWLVSRLPKLYREWPAMHEVRAVFCSKFRPKDGIEVYSETYADGIPSEREALLALPAAQPKQLPAGEPASASPSIAATIADLARAKDMNRIAAAPAEVREIPVVKLTDANRITPEMIERAAQELREKRAKEEINA